MADLERLKRMAYEGDPGAACEYTVQLRRGCDEAAIYSLVQALHEEDKREALYHLAHQLHGNGQFLYAMIRAGVSWKLSVQKRPEGPWCARWRLWSNTSTHIWGPENVDLPRELWISGGSKALPTGDIWRRRGWAQECWEHSKTAAPELHAQPHEDSHAAWLYLETERRLQAPQRPDKSVGFLLRLANVVWTAAATDSVARRRLYDLQRTGTWRRMNDLVAHQTDRLWWWLLVPEDPTNG